MKLCIRHKVGFVALINSHKLIKVTVLIKHDSVYLTTPYMTRTLPRSPTTQITE